MALPFLNPWLLLATLGIAVPIAIHLLNRHRFKTYDWAAMLLLRKVVRVRSRQLRLEDILLLVLRCLAVLLLALAVARPVTKWAGLIKKADVGAVIALDVSYSMAHQPGVNDSRFDRARDRVREIAASIEPGNPVTLVLMADRPRVILRNVAYDAGQFEEALRRIEPLPEGLSRAYDLSELAPLMAEMKAPKRELYLVTDGQETSWGGLTDKDRSLLGDLSDLGRVFFVTPEVDGEDNVALTRFELTAGALRKDQTALFTAQVRNLGPSEQSGIEVNLFADEAAVDRQFISRLAPGQMVAVPLYATWLRDGEVRLSASVGSDALALDNVRYAVADIRKGVRVLCVDGGSDRAGSGATDFLVTALAPRKSADASLQVVTIPWLALPAVRFTDFDVVMLANIADVPGEKASALYDFVEGGGGLVVFMGSNVKPDVLNQHLRRGESAILPAELVAPFPDARERSDGQLMDTAVPDHPLAGALKSLRPGLLGDARFMRWMKVKAYPDGRPLLRLAGSGDPILLEKPLGRGKVLLFTSSADRSWNNLVLNPAYAVLVQQAVTYLCRRPHERPVTVGQPLILPLVGEEMPSGVSVTDPKGKVAMLSPVRRDGQMWVELPQTEWSGFYEVQAGADAPATAVAVNVDPAESDVKVLRAEDLTAAFAGTSVRVLAPGQDVAGVVQESRVGRELWRYLVAGAFALMFLEVLAARQFWRRGRKAAVGASRSAGLGPAEQGRRDGEP